MNTGRYFYVDKASGRKFCIEPISGRNQRKTDKEVDIGGVMQTEGGSINECDSIITEENGFTNITYLPAGVSPDGYIQQILLNSNNDVLDSTK